MLELEALEVLDPVDRQRVLDLDLYQHVIFVSANAVRFGMEWIEDAWPQLPVGLNWYAVGDRSAALLASHGLSVMSPDTDMSSEGLLRLPSLTSVAEQRVLIIRGQGGRTTLREELTARGARVEDLACYRRVRPALAAGELAQELCNWGVRIVLISSGEGLQNLLALLSPEETTKFRGIILIVPSQRVASMARDAGFSRIVTAENATDGAMLGALETCKPSSGD